MNDDLIEHEPFSIAKYAADAAAMNTTVTMRVFFGSPRRALDYKITPGGTLAPPAGYEAIVSDGMVTGMRKVLDPAPA